MKLNSLEDVDTINYSSKGLPDSELILNAENEIDDYDVKKKA